MTGVREAYLSQMLLNKLHGLKEFPIRGFCSSTIFFFGRLILLLHVYVDLSPLSLFLGSRGTWFALRCLNHSVAASCNAGQNGVSNSLRYPNELFSRRKWI
eukprot:s5351_g2.t1